MRLLLCLAVTIAVATKDTWAVVIRKSSDGGTQLSSPNSESTDAASSQGFLSDTTHQFGKLGNILSTVGRLKNVLHAPGVPARGRASNTDPTQKMRESLEEKAKSMKKAVQKGATTSTDNQSYLGRYEPPDLNSKDEGNDRTQNKLKRQQNRHRNQEARGDRTHKNTNARQMYEKIKQYCSKLHKTINEKRKDYYKTKGCRDPKKCKSYTKIHHITRDYESVTYRRSTGSRFCSKFLRKMNDNEYEEY